ncbi:ash family protein [Salmonella enterica]|nr:ash family protein [Salmonella enterica]
MREACLALLAASYRTLYRIAAPAKSGVGFSILNIHTGGACFLCRAFSYISMVGWAVASQDAPVSSMAGNANSAQSATHEISISGGGLNTTYWRLPYGYNPYPHSPVTFRFFQRRHRFHHTGWTLRASGDRSAGK